MTSTLYGPGAPNHTGGAREEPGTVFAAARLTAMRDTDVRSALHSLLRVWHADEPDTRVVDELDLCNGSARVDVAVLNGKLTCWEIKSPRDRLDRLPGQVDYYSRVCDEAWLVTDARHLVAAESMVPDWWGLMLIDEAPDGGAALSVGRPALTNPEIDPAALVRLLWREETLAALERAGRDTAPLARAPRRDLWAALVDELDEFDVRNVVREQLKAREHWRRPSRPRPRGRRTNGRRLPESA